MIIPAAGIRLTLTRSFLHLTVLLFLSLPPGFAAFAQGTTVSTTPPGIAPGAPAGSYPLSGFENVNLYNGNLNFHLPIAFIGGRGKAGYTMTLTIDNKKWIVHTDDVFQSHWADYYWWTGFKPGLGAGVMNVRTVSTDPIDCSPYGYQNWYTRSLSRLTFTAPDGTEYEFRDALNNGSRTVNDLCGVLHTARRGKVWVSSEGSATFICDQEIYDNPWEPGGENGQVLTTGGGALFNISGYLLMRDGTRYRIDNNFVSSIRDANGNKVTISSGTPTVVTDSLNRTVTAGADVNGNAVITFKGAGGATRQIKIWYRNLSYGLSNPADPDRVLRADFTSPLKTTLELFPSLNGSPTTPFNPMLVSAVELPDGRRYQFRYNYYGELAKVILPTGGSYEYDWEAGPGADSSGVVRYTDTMQRSHIGIYRRVKERRVYSGGTTLESKTVFTPSHPSYNDPRPWTTTVMAVNKDASGAFLSSSKHYFTGSPSSSMVTFPYDYSEWDDGREYQTQTLADDSPSPTVLRQSSMTWQNGPGGPSYVNWHYYNDRHPPVSNPRVVETFTTFMDVSPNLVSKQTSIDPVSGAVGFDQYNNPTDVWEYDYGVEEPGALLRHTQNSYLTSGYDTVAGTPINPNLEATIHIRNLPIQKQVFDAGGIMRAETLYEYDLYDNSSNHASLVDRPGISGHDGAFSTGYLMRGNVTKTSSALLNNSGGVTGSVNSHAQYDIAGNVVKTIDANDKATTLDFSDRFGSADDEAQSNAGAPELGEGFSYAFPTKVTNALNHKAYTQYDYYLGKPVNAEDANGIVSSVAYNDALDRPTQAIQARYKVTTPPCAPPSICVPAEKRQTTIAYDDANRVITTSSDRDAFGDNLLKGEIVYDGLGRTIESRTYAPGPAGCSNPCYSLVKTTFDAMGRTYQVSNPYWNHESPIWTTTQYDALSRMTSVTTPDGAHVDTAYSGNQVTVTDEAGKKRSSETDALGRLVKVIEDPGTGKLNYDTTYLYDALGNLRKVTQGAQTRWFFYDSLSRLIRAKNPEQADNSNLSFTDPVTSHNGWSMAYTYDANGNLDSKIDARNITTSYEYDALNRNTEVNYSDTTPDIRRQYDGATNGKGRFWADYAGGFNPTDQEGEHNAIDSYDALGRPRTKRHQFKVNGVWSAPYSVHHDYDLAGNVKRVTYPWGSGRYVDYSYDQAGRLFSFGGNLGGSQRNYAATILYNAAGQMIKERFGTNTSLYHNSHYNDRQQLVSTRVGDNETDEWNWSRGAIGFYYGTTAVNTGDIFASDTDNNGNLRRQINFVGNVIPQLDDYTYDALNRISSFNEIQRDSGGQWIPNVASQNFSYDRYGNRKITSAIGGVSDYNPTYDPTNNTNRIVGLGYDAAGNITSDLLTGGTMIYDAENRLLTATKGGVVSRYTYDADGRRVRRIIGALETWQVYGIGGELLAEYAASAQPTAPQKEYGYRGGQLLIVAESGSGGGVSFVKPALKSSADLIGKAGLEVDGNADELSVVDESVADLEFNEDYGSTTADVSSDNDTGKHLDRVTRTSVGDYGNALLFNDIGGALPTEHPPAAAPSAPRKEYGYRRGPSRSPVAAQSVVTIYPGANQTPDPGQGGGAVSPPPTNTGHGSTYTEAWASASGGYGTASDSSARSARWSAFQSVSGGILSIRLKFDWSVSGSASASAGGGGSAQSLSQLNIYYSLNGGSSWILRVATGVSASGNTSQNLSDSGSDDILLSVGQDITQVQVRDFMSASASASGGEIDGSSSQANITASISSIRLEVTIAPPVISNVAAGGITTSGATITWSTDFNSDSQVEYGTTTAYGQSTALNPALVTAHSQGLSGLTAGTLYHYRVKSRDAYGNLAVSGDFTFTTSPDVTAPVISNVAAGGITASGATITWTTDENSDTQVEYGPTTAYGQSTALNPTLVTAHSQVLSGLTAGTVYHYRVKSRDAAGNLAMSVDFTFTTAPDTTPPAITSFSPAAGTTNVNANANVTVTFSEAMDAATVNGSTVELRDPSNTIVSASVSYNAASLTATLDPTASLAAGVTYTARVRGGSTDPRVKDVAGNALAADVTWTFTTAQNGSGGIKWLVTDHLGSTRMVIDETGSLAGIKRHDFAPFGEELIAGPGIRSEGNGYSGDSTRQKFTGKERDDETKLDYFGARYYASIQGRFTSTDPIALSSKRLLDPQGINLYSYARNNPLNTIDPDGEDYTETTEESFSFTIERRARAKSGELIRQVRVDVKVKVTKTYGDYGNVLDTRSKATATATNTDIANITLTEEQLRKVEKATAKIVEQADIQGVDRAEVLGIGAKETFLGSDFRRGAADFQQPAINPLQLTSDSGRTPTTDLETNVRRAVGHYHLVGLQGYGPGPNNLGGATYVSEATGYINQIKAGMSGSIRTSAPSRSPKYYLDQQEFRSRSFNQQEFKGRPYRRLP